MQPECNPHHALHVTHLPLHCLITSPHRAHAVQSVATKLFFQVQQDLSIPDSCAPDPVSVGQASGCTRSSTTEVETIATFSATLKSCSRTATVSVRPGVAIRCQPSNLC